MRLSVKSVQALGKKLLLFTVFAAPIQTAQTPGTLSGVVEDETKQPVPGADVTLHSPTFMQRTSTNELGRFRFDSVPPGDYLLDFDKAGFFRLSDYAVTMTAEPTEITVTLNHEYEIRSQVDVVSTPHEIVPGETRHEEELVAHEIREDPVPSSHSLQNALPAVPGVVQDNTGLLHVAGGRVEDTLYTLDGFELNDPASGLFNARVNVDTVRSADIATGRYGTEFANAGSGVLALQTDTGDDHWRFGTTNFFPSPNFERGTHLGNWFPRMTFSGPIHKGRAWFSNAVSVQHSFALVRELPPGSDISDEWAGDNLLRLQYNVTPLQSLQGNFLYNGSIASRTGLGPFSPAATTTDLHTHRYLISMKDQITVARGLLDIGVASDADHLRRLPQGTETYVLTPTGPEGNYFENVLQDSRRWQGHAELTLPGRQWHGAHDILAGFNVDGTHLDQTANRHTVEVRQPVSLVRSVSFAGNAQFSASEFQSGGYVQDSWKALPYIIFESGLRIDRNDFTGRTLPQPRFVLNWIPRSTNKVSLGWGFYYQPVYLSLIGQTYDQQRIDVLNGVLAAPVITSFSRPAGLDQPYFQTTSAEWQKEWNPQTMSTIHFMERDQRNGLVYENVSADPSRQDLRLNNSRRDRYRSIEFSVRRSLPNNTGDLMAGYTYSRAHSNKVFNYSLEDFLLTPQAAGPLTWDTPHRLVSHGAVQTHLWSLLFSYFVDYRTGFPFSAVNSRYQVVDTPNGFRYPPSLDVNIGAEKRFPFYGYQWAFRLSVINATGHHNYDAVINNVDAPNFLTFSGGQRRAFTTRLRLVGRR